MTAEDFIAAYRAAPRAEAQRLGQAAFNMLQQERPELAGKLRATDIDPFYSDHELPAFESFLRKHWGDPA